MRPEQGHDPGVGEDSVEHAPPEVAGLAGVEEDEAVELALITDREGQARAKAAFHDLRRVLLIPRNGCQVIDDAVAPLHREPKQGGAVIQIRGVPGQRRGGVAGSGEGLEQIGLREVHGDGDAMETSVAVGTVQLLPDSFDTGVQRR